MFSLEDRGRETDKPKEERGNYKDRGARWKREDYVFGKKKQNVRGQRWINSKRVRKKLK